MGYYCTVPQCTSLAGKTKNVKFHKFPKDDTMADKWNIILKRGKPITKYSKVCSLHFTQADYNVTTMGQWKTLSKDAVPSQNLPKLNPDGTVMVIRKSRTVKYREGKKEDSDKMDKSWQSVTSGHGGHSFLSNGPDASVNHGTHDTSILAYRLQTLGAIANAISPSHPLSIAHPSPHPAPHGPAGAGSGVGTKPRKQDAIMQTDPVLNEDDDTQPNNSYSEVSDKSYSSELDQYNQSYPKDYPKEYPKDSYSKDNSPYSKEAPQYPRESTPYSKEQMYPRDSTPYKETSPYSRESTPYPTDATYPKDTTYKESYSKDSTYKDATYPKDITYSKDTTYKDPTYPKDGATYKDPTYPKEGTYKDTSYQKDSSYSKEDTSYQKTYESKNYEPKDYTKSSEDYIPQTNEEYNKEAEKYALERKSHNGYDLKDYHKQVLQYQKLPDLYTMDKYGRDGYFQNGYPDSAELLRNQQHNLLVLQEQHRITENQNFFNENHIKQEIDISADDDKFLYERSKEQLESPLYAERERRLQHHRILEHFQHQVKQEPDSANGCDDVLQPAGSPYYPSPGHTGAAATASVGAVGGAGAGAGHGGATSFYDSVPRPGPELLIAKQNALAAHTQLWQNMKRPFFYSDSPHYNAPQLLHRYEDIPRILQ